MAPVSAKPSRPHYQLLDHTADIGIRLQAHDLKTLYAQAALAMFDLICDPACLSVAGHGEVSVAGYDPPDLMIEWLSELLYQWTGRQRLVCCIQVASLTTTRIAAGLGWDRFDPARHALKHEIKAVTYHRAGVERVAGGWRTCIFFDV